MANGGRRGARGEWRRPEGPLPEWCMGPEQFEFGARLG